MKSQSLEHLKQFIGGNIDAEHFNDMFKNYFKHVQLSVKVDKNASTMNAFPSR